MADAADHAWTIAMATGCTPLPPVSPPLRHSGGGLNAAARHVLLALYLHHRDLHLPDPQLPAPQSGSPNARSVGRHGTRGDSSLPPNHLPPVQHRPRPAERNALPAQRTPLPGTPPAPCAHLASPDEATAARMDPADQRAHVRGLEARLREAHRWHACSPSPPQGQGGSPAPDTDQAKKTEKGQGARQRAHQQGAVRQQGPRSSHAALPHAQTPGAHKQHCPHQPPPPPPYHSTLSQQPSQQPTPTHVHAMPGPPYTQSQGTRHHRYHHHAPVPP